MSAARTERLLNLLTLLLNAKKALSLREIRDLEEFAAYQTSDPKSGERAFERDKSALIELGVPLRWIAPEQDDEEEGGYVIDRDRYFLPELDLSPADLALLSIAGAAAAAIEGFPGRAAVLRALAKLGFDAPEIGTAPGLVHAPVQDPEPKRIAALLAELHEAVALRRRVGLRYRKAPKETSERQVDPYGLYYRQGAWYLVGFCQLRRAERTFHLSRIDALTSVPGCQGDDFVLPESFDLSAHAERRPWEFPQGEPVEVSIRLAERLVAAVPEIFGDRAEIVERLSDGSARLRLVATHPDALVAAVLPFGAAAEVLKPASLRAQVGEIFAALAARYADVADELEGGVAPAQTAAVDRPRGRR